LGSVKNFEECAVHIVPETVPTIWDRKPVDVTSFTRKRRGENPIKKQGDQHPEDNLAETTRMKENPKANPMRQPCGDNKYERKP
jgi:hypothetical protein